MSPLLDYPLHLRFKILALGTRVIVTDAHGREVMFVRQKSFKLKEAIHVYEDASQANVKFDIKADRVLDFNARYTVTDPDGKPVGAVQREGVRSFWRATYGILDANGNPVGRVHEENPWMKVLDTFLGRIPFLSMFINPAYLVELGDRAVMRLQKEPAFFEGKFNLTLQEKVTDEEETRLLAGVLMTVLFERERG